MLNKSKLLLSALLSLGCFSVFAQQTFRFNIILEEVLWRGIDGDPTIFDSSDPSWNITWRLYNRGSLLREGSRGGCINDRSMGTGSLGIETGGLNGNSFGITYLTTNGTGPANPFDLCDIELEIVAEAFERDNGPFSNTPNSACAGFQSGDDNRDIDVLIARQPLQQLIFNPNSSVRVIAGFEASAISDFYYILDMSWEIDCAAEAISYRNTAGAPQTVFCGGDSYQLCLDPKFTGFTNGYHAWERKDGPGPNDWTRLPETSNCLVISASEPLKQYRVRQMAGPNRCLFDPQDWVYSDPAALTIVPAPPAPSNMVTSLNRTCGTANDMSITLERIDNYPPSSIIKVTLVPPSGPPQNKPDMLANQLPTTFTGLGEGSYTIKVSGVTNNTAGDAIANCTSEKNLGALLHYPDPILSGPFVTQPSCPGGSGQISVGVTNGNGPFTYQLRSGSNVLQEQPNTFNSATFTVNPPFANSYFVRVSNTFSCAVNTISIGFADPQPLAGTATISRPIACAGETGTVLVDNISGGTGARTISYRQVGSTGAWATAVTNAGVQETFNLLTGNWEIRLSDANNCTQVIGTVNLDQPAVALSVEGTGTTASSCRDDGSLTVMANGGQAPYTYTLTPGGQSNNTGSFSGLASGNYTVTVRDGRGCERSTAVQVDRFDSLQINVVNQNNLLCAGDGDGSIEVSASGGSGGYVYSIDGNTFQASPVFSSLNGGPITVTVEDSRGCQMTVSGTIEEPQSFLLSNYNEVSPILCQGGTSTVLITFTGREDTNDPLMVSTDGGSSFSSINFTKELEPELLTYITLTLTPGDYDIVLKDKNDCTAIGTIMFTISEPTPVIALLDSVNNISCFTADDGRIHLDLAGGTSPYSVTLLDADDDGQIQQATNINAGTYVVSNVPPHNNYKVVVTDANGCTVEIPGIEITTPTLLTLTAQNTGDDIDCSLSNGEITATPSGGTPPYQYSLDNVNYGASAILTGATTSNTVYVRDANGCVAQQTVNIPQLPFAPNPVVTVLEPAIDQCQNATIRIDFTPNGFAHSWKISTPAADCDSPVKTANTAAAASFFEVSDLPAGMYQICATAANCASPPIPFEIVELDSIKLEITAVQHVNCFGESTGSVTLSASGGVGLYTIKQNNADARSGSTTTYTGLAAGNYFYTVEDSKGCFTGELQVINQNDILDYTNLDLQDALCADSSSGAIRFNPIGGAGPYTARWRAATGTYSSVAVTGTPSDPVVMIDNLPAGTYDVEIIDVNACRRSFQFNLGQPPAQSLALSDTSHITCFGFDDGQISATATGGTPAYTFALDNGSFVSDSDFSGITPGSHTLTVRDLNGCRMEQPFFIKEPTALAATLDVQNVQCKDADDGRIVVNASGATPDYQYALNGSAFGSSPVFTGLAPGSYVVEVQDAKGCSLLLPAQTITEPDLLQSNTSLLEEATCANGGTAVVTYTGGTGPYTIMWDNVTALNTDTIRDLSPGIHSVQITDAQGCVALDTVDVTTEGVPIIVVEDIGLPHCDDAIGYIDIAVRGSVRGPFSYTIDSLPDTDGLFTGLSAGDYEITVADTLGCASTRIINISAPPIPQIDVLDITGEACGQMDGSVVLSASQGDGSYIFSLSAGTVNNNQVSGLAAGNYEVTVTDGRNCVGTTSVVVPQIEHPTATVATLPEVCGRSNGQLTVMPDDIAGPFTYSWPQDTNLVGPTATGLTSGNYQVTVTNDRGCSSVISGNVGVINPPSIELQELAPASCDQNDGRLEVWVRGGNAFSVNWRHSASTSLIQNNLAPGRYHVSVTNANGCRDTMSFLVEEQRLSDISIELKESTCDDQNGEIKLGLDSTKAPYLFAWSHDTSLSSSVASDLAPGAYSVTITDNNGCSGTVDTVIAASQSLSVQTSVTPISCAGNDGTIAVAVEVDGGPYTYQWMHDSLLTDSMAANLSAGSYTVLVSDATGCSVRIDTTLILEDSIQILIDSIGASQCGQENGMIMLDGPNRDLLTYLWSHDSTLNQSTATDLSPGIYTILVSQGPGCERLLEAEIRDEGFVDITLDSVAPANCGQRNGRAMISTQGGAEPLTIDWFDMSIPDSLVAEGMILEQVAAGDYLVRVTDMNQCSNELTVAIPLTDTLELMTSVNTPSCPGVADGSATATTNLDQEGLTWQWNDPQMQQTATATGLAAGTYTVTVDGPGCSIASEVVVTDPVPINFELAIAQAPTCFGAADAAIAVTLPDIPIALFELNEETVPPTSQIGDLSAGLYTLTITDSSGCQSADSILISDPQPLVLSPGIINGGTCDAAGGGNAEILISGGTGPYTIQWSDSTQQSESIAFDLPSGPVGVLVTDANACSDSLLLTIPEPSRELALTVDQIRPPSCVGSSDGFLKISIPQGSGSYSYLWNDALGSTDSLAGLSAGQYIIQVMDDLTRCQGTDTVSLIDPDPIDLEFAVNDVTCGIAADGMIALTASGGNGGFVYSWNSGDTSATLTGLVADTYTVTASDANGCIKLDSVVVRAAEVLDLDLGGSQVTICSGEQHYVELPDSAGVSYSWNGPNGFSSQERSVLLPAAGVYYVEASSASCMQMDSVEIVQSDVSLQSSFVLPSRVLLGDTVVALEVSWPVPDDVVWLYDESLIDRISVGNNTHYFIFGGLGTYDIGLQSLLGDCVDFQTKTVEVVQDSADLAFPIDPGNRQILSAQLQPNPNMGQFSLIVELSSVADMLVQLNDVLGTVVDTRVEQGSSQYQIDYNLNLQPGVHAITIQVRSERKTIMFLVN